MIARWGHGPGLRRERNAPLMKELEGKAKEEADLSDCVRQAERDAALGNDAPRRKRCRGQRITDTGAKLAATMAVPPKGPIIHHSLRGKSETLLLRP